MPDDILLAGLAVGDPELTLAFDHRFQRTVFGGRRARSNTRRLGWLAYAPRLAVTLDQGRNRPAGFSR